MTRHSGGREWSASRIMDSDQAIVRGGARAGGGDSARAAGGSESQTGAPKEQIGAGGSNATRAANNPAIGPGASIRGAARRTARV